MTTWETRPYPRTLSRERTSTSPTRLSQAFEAAIRIPFDDRASLVLFSDSHRGDKSKLDAFAPNKELFLGALKHYYHKGFTYVEVGDGDELWKGWQFDDIQRAYGDVFELLHRFERQGRLHLLIGNHEALTGGGYQVDKGGLPAGEAIVLERSRTRQRIFVVHGHQADPQNDARRRWSRLVVRHLWTPLQSMGLAGLGGPAHPVAYHAKDAVSMRVHAWAAANHQMVICGHTHRPAFARPGATPYFNTGACLFPGQITGIEIVRGRIQLVRWEAGSVHPARSAQVRRRALTPSVPLDSY